MAEDKELTQAEITEYKTKEANGTLTTEDIANFTKSIRNTSEARLASLDSTGELTDLYTRLNKNPKFKNHAKRRDILSGIEGGLEAFRTLSKLSTARRQKDEYEREKNALREPQAPPTTPKNRELESATETARRDLSSPLRDIDPMLQRNLDLLRAGMSNAKTIGGGQAGITGSLQQATINDARRGTQAMIPQIAEIRRGQRAEYNRLIAAGINEDDMRFKQAMRKYIVAEDKYMIESEAVGKLGQQANRNIYNQQEDLWDQVSNIAGGYFDSIIKDGFSKQTPAQQGAEGLPPLPEGAILNMNFDPAGFTGGVNRGSIASMSKYSAIAGLGSQYQDYRNNLKTRLNQNYGKTLPFNNYLGQK